MKRPAKSSQAGTGWVNLFPDLQETDDPDLSRRVSPFIASAATTTLVERDGFLGVSVTGTSQTASGRLSVLPEAMPLTAGSTFSISAHLELEQALAGVLAVDARRMVVSWRSGSDGPQNSVRSEPGLNVASDNHLTLTVALPDDASDVRLEFVAGAQAGHGTAIWSRFTCTETHLPHDLDAENDGGHGSEALLEAAADRLDTRAIHAQLAARPDLRATAVGAYAAGVVAEDAGQQGEARDKYRTAVDLDGSLWGPRHRLAVAAVDASRLTRASKVLEPVAQDPRTPSSLLDRLSTKMNRATGRKAEAAQWARWGAERDPLAEGLDLERMIAARPVTLASRVYLAAMVRERLDDIRERAARSLALSRSREVAEHEHDRVYVFWAQGFDQAPDVVQACHRRLIATQPEGAVVSLSMDDIPQFVEMPAIASRVGNNVTKLSNLLRLELLKKYGGCWVDATCWVNRPVSVLAPRRGESEFFTYQIKDTRSANWFISASHTSYLLHMMSAAHEIYWETHDYLVHYFVFHGLFEALVMLDPECGRIWEACDHLPASGPHRLQWRMFDEYSRAEAERLKQASVVHKLTYKFDREIPTNSNLAAIIRDEF